MSEPLIAPPKWWRDAIFTSANAAAITETNVETLKSWQRGAHTPLGSLVGNKRYFTFHELFQLSVIGVLHSYGMGNPKFSYSVARKISHAGEVPRPPRYDEVANISDDGLCDENTPAGTSYVEIKVDEVWRELISRATPLVSYQ